MAPGDPDGLDDGDGEPGLGLGLGFGLGDGWGAGAGGAALIVYVVHAGVELTEASVPHTLYEPGKAPRGGAVGGVGLVHLVPELDGTGLLAQFAVLPKDQDTWP